MTAWRIFKPRHRDTAFTGDGARLYGGRWNSKGVPIVYTAESHALAALELLVHLQSADVLASYLVCSVSFAATLVERIDASKLPRDWASALAATRAMGDAWVRETRSVVLAVPSCVVPCETIYLLNPLHPDFRKLAIGRPGAFQFDSRLV